MPLYAVYALLFRDSGLTAGQISSLFILWSVASFVLEVPSGAWADTFDRRSLLVVSAVVYGAGFSVWMLVPTYTGFAIGFVCWGLSSAIMSGTFEALLYDELAASDATDAFAALLGWSHAAAMGANLVATVLAAPLMQLGGYSLVGWTSVGLAGAQAVLAAALPSSASVSPRRSSRGIAHAAPRDDVRRYMTMLRSGIREATSAPRVRRTLLIAAVLVGMTAYDEYFPLMAADTGVATARIPLLVALVVVGQVAGTALAGRTGTMKPRSMAAVVATGVAGISLGALTGSPIGFLAIALGYGLLNNAMIVGEARLQQVISGPARATVTSVLGLATEVVALLVYLLFTVGAGATSVAGLVALLGLPMALTAVAIWRWFPSAPATPPGPSAAGSTPDNAGFHGAT